MDEITLVNLLNKICEINRELTWKLSCKHHDGMHQSQMQICLLRASNEDEVGTVIFEMNNGLVEYGHHQGMTSFRKAAHLLDVLLDIIIYETNKTLVSDN